MTGNDAIGLLYDAALGESDWADALAVVSEEINGAAMLLGSGSPYDPASFETWLHRFDLEPFRSAGFEIQDHYDPAHNPCIGPVMSMPLATSSDVRTFLTNPAFFSTPFGDVMARQTITKARLFVVQRDRGCLAGGFIGRREHKEIGESEAQRFDALLPHMARALRLREEIDRRRSITTSLEEALSLLTVGVLLVDRDLRVRFRNEAGERCLTAQDGLSYCRGRLRIASPKLQSQLERCVVEASAVDSAAIGVPRRSMLAPYTLRIFPAIGTGEVSGSRGACAIVLIHDPSSASALPDVTLLGVAYGLTPAEAAVARLVPLAENKRRMAERLGISENTVKSHLAAIRAKLGARNLGELLRLIEQLTLVRDSDSLQEPSSRARET